MNFDFEDLVKAMQNADEDRVAEFNALDEMLILCIFSLVSCQIVTCAQILCREDIMFLMIFYVCWQSP